MSNSKLHLGISGTQEGCTEKQGIALLYLLSQLKDSIVCCRHGDCVGTDQEFHGLVRKVCPTVGITIHPPENSSKRAFCKGDRLLPPKPYLERNKDIVSKSDIMFIVPKEDTEQIRSGTWSTYRYTIKAKKPFFIIYPSGKYKSGCVDK